MGEQGGLMAGKRGLIMGVANERSIAWGIARAAAPTAPNWPSPTRARHSAKRSCPWRNRSASISSFPAMSPTIPASIPVFAAIAERWGRMDFVVHAIAFSDKDELKGKYVNTSRKNFALTLDISCYSFTAVSQRAAKLMPDGGSLLNAHLLRRRARDAALQRHGVAKAALEASVRYMAATSAARTSGSTPSPPARSRPWRPRASAIFAISQWNELNSPLKRNVTTEDVGGAGLYL